MRIISSRGQAGGSVDVPANRWVRVREGGDVLETIDLDRGCFACTLGGVNRTTLFLIAAEWSNVANMLGGGTRTGQGEFRAERT